MKWGFFIVGLLITILALAVLYKDKVIEFLSSDITGMSIIAYILLGLGIITIIASILAGKKTSPI